MSGTQPTPSFPSVADGRREGGQAPQIERRRGRVWNGKTPRGQRFFGIDFERFAVGVLLDG